MDTEQRAAGLSIRRVLLTLLYLQGAPITRAQLISQVKQELGEEAYPVDETQALHRDIEKIRGSGVEVLYSRGDNTYQLSGPPFRLALSPKELDALAFLRHSFRHNVPYFDSVQSLIGKIAGHLPAGARQVLERKPTLLIDVAPADKNASTLSLEVIRRALSQRQQLEFIYTSMASPTPHKHTLEPYELVYRDGHFYLTGYSFEDRRVADFRVDRIVEGTAKVLPTRLPPGQRHQRTFTLRYRVMPELARYGVSERFPKQRVRKHADGSVTVTAECTNILWAARKLLRYGEMVIVEEPPEVREEVRRTVAAMARLYDIRVPRLRIAAERSERYVHRADRRTD